MGSKFYSKEYYDNNVFVVNVVITDDCNYHCQYCANTHPRQHIYINLDMLYKFILHLRQLTTRHILIQLVGGEPMMHKDLLHFCQLVDKLNIKCVILTNFSFDIQKYLQFPDSTEFNASYHYNSKQKNIFVDNFLKIPDKKLKNFNFYIMYEHGFTDIDIKVFNIIKKRTKRAELKKLFNTVNYNRQYTEEERKAFMLYVNEMRDNGFSVEDTFILEKDNGTKQYVDKFIKDEGKNLFKHWKCNAGKEFLNIDWNGIIYPCVSLVDHPIGNIKNFQSFDLNKCVLCTAKQCCIYDVKKENVLNLVENFNN